MRTLLRTRFFFPVLGIVGFLFCAARCAAIDTLNWNTNLNRVTADIQSVEVVRLLEAVAKLTGWKVYIESNTTFNVSAKFSDIPSGTALRRLLGDLNFALVPETNSNPRLYVFHSSQKNATRLLRPSDLNPTAGAKAKAKAIPNELIVRLKPGADIDALARALGARVVGRMDSLNAYRLQFDNEAAADAARNTLSGNSDVAGIESNYFVAPPSEPMKLDFAGTPPVQLKLNPPDSSGRVIVALIDTAFQPLGNDLDKFVLKPLSIAGTADPDPNVPSHSTSMAANIITAASAASEGSTSMQIQPVRVSDDNQTINMFNVAAGIVEAVNKGANIINLSLGGPGDSVLLHDIIQQAAQKGIPVFAAAGNDASPEPFYPAAYPEVISVTAGQQGKLANYANFGNFVDLMAPGSSVVYFNNNAYLVNGTSTSTAFVSGTVGATAANKNAPVSQVVSAILASPAFKFVPLK